MSRAIDLWPDLNFLTCSVCEDPLDHTQCAGVVQATGRRAHGLIVESADGEIHFPLPTLIECNSMPDNRDEIPTTVAALHHRHLKVIADKIPPIDPSAKILLLLRRDIIRAHKVRQQLLGPHDAPYALGHCGRCVSRKVSQALSCELHENTHLREWHNKLLQSMQ